MPCSLNNSVNCSAWIDTKKFYLLFLLSGIHSFHFWLCCLKSVNLRLNQTNVQPGINARKLFCTEHRPRINRQLMPKFSAGVLIAVYARPQDRLFYSEFETFDFYDSLIASCACNALKKLLFLTSKMCSCKTWLAALKRRWGLICHLLWSYITLKYLFVNTIILSYLSLHYLIIPICTRQLGNTDTLSWWFE